MRRQESILKILYATKPLCYELNLSATRRRSDAAAGIDSKAATARLRPTARAKGAFKDMRVYDLK